jgi:GMP synthase-like glutamine amidotransferase
MLSDISKASGARMKIGILATGITPAELLSQHGSYADMFIDMLGPRAPGMTFEVFDVREERFPDNPEQCDGWIITGSKCGVYDDLPWMRRLKVLIRETYEAGRPQVGICFGHQIIAAAFGAPVAKSERGWGVGIHRYDIVGSHGFLDAGAPSFRINAMHQDQVLEVPAQAQLLATSAFCPCAGLVYGDRILTLQAHPEFSIDYERALLLARRGNAVPEAVADAGLATLDTDRPTDTPRVARWILNVLRYPETGREQNEQKGV